MRGSCGIPGNRLPEAEKMRARASRISSLANPFTVVKMRDCRSNEIAKKGAAWPASVSISAP
jgi:hypothetical protein